MGDEIQSSRFVEKKQGLPHGSGDQALDRPTTELPGTETERWREAFTSAEILPKQAIKTADDRIVEARQYLRSSAQSALTQVYSSPYTDSFHSGDKDRDDFLSGDELKTQAASFDEMNKQVSKIAPDILLQTKTTAQHPEDQFTLKGLHDDGKDDGKGISLDDFDALAQKERESKYLGAGASFLEDHFARLDQNRDGLLDKSDLDRIIKADGLGLTQLASLLVVSDAYDDVVAADPSSQGKGISRESLSIVKGYKTTLPDLKIYEKASSTVPKERPTSGLRPIPKVGTKPLEVITEAVYPFSE